MFIGASAPAILPWLAGSVTLHGLHSLVLTRSYTLNDFSVAFPGGGGTRPRWSTAGGALLYAETPGVGEIWGVAAICAGIFSLSAGGRIGRKGLIAALGAGVLTAAYTVVDAGGMRASDGVLPFLCWFFLATGIALTIPFRVSAGPSAFARMRKNLRPGIAAGSLAIARFGSTLVAFRYAHVAILRARRHNWILVRLLFPWVTRRESV